MKRLFAGLLIGIMCVGATAQAAPGDINGGIYATDIRAYINGVEVPSYNIGGKTAVIVEDVLPHSYENSLRTLIIHEFMPGTVKTGQNTQPNRPNGTKIGNTYETDIKTYVYDKEIQGYSLNGKMAVAIEDLGSDKCFNELGGKYVWNPDERTISLEFIHFGNPGITDIMKEKHVNLVVDENYNGEFVSAPIMNGSTSGIKIPQDGLPHEIYVDDKVIGYVFCPDRANFHQNENGEISLEISSGIVYMYFLPETVTEILKDVEPTQPTREEWLEYFETQWMTVIDSLETEEYTFLYMSQPNFHGSTQLLRRVDKDGNVICYESEFESVSLHGNKFFDNVVIDKENEKVTFRYDRDYEIDLKTGELK